MPNAVYQHDVEAYVGDDTARGCIVYFDGMVMEVLAFRLVNRPGSSTTTIAYKDPSGWTRIDETSGLDRAASYYNLYQTHKVRYYQVWWKNPLGVWKAEGGVQKLGDPARARS